MKTLEKLRWYKKLCCFFKVYERDFEKKVPEHDKYITANDFNKFSGTIFEERWKQTKLATTNYLCTVEQHAIKMEEKIWKLQTWFKFFIGKSYISDDASQNFLIFQLFLNILTLSQSQLVLQKQL